jgi:SAM-dependent methyltransferase
MTDTSWENSSGWYNKIVGEDGQYFHQRIVIPGVIRLLDLKIGESLIDLGCGQGILGRSIPRGIEYMGLDASPSLIEYAKKMDREENHAYKLADVTKKLPVNKDNYDKAAIVMALQNMADSESAIGNASEKLIEGGKLVIVLNHPYFRIPKSSGWGVDKEKKIQYRWIIKYMSALKIPILTNPGTEKSLETWSFHKPLSKYCDALQKSGMVIETIEEWVSDKKSTGAMAMAEDNARKEIPLFMAIGCRKI